MSQLTALSLSIGVLGGIATWLFLLIGGLLIWAAFLGWACFFHEGGDGAALRKTIVGNVFGAFVAWIAALILSLPLGEALPLPVWAGIVVGITVFGLCLAAKIQAFSSIPASVYGYAAAFAFLLLTPGSLDRGALLSGGMDNALIAVAISMAIGALFGTASGKLGAALTKAPAPTVEQPSAEI
ncbi:MAG: DUF1097 domain-containing protein [Gemmatimonadota bacterium]